MRGLTDTDNFEGLLRNYGHCDFDDHRTPFSARDDRRALRVPSVRVRLIECRIQLFPRTSIPWP